MIVNKEISARTNCQRPTSMFSERVQHVVEEANARVESDLLGGCYLGGMASFWQWY
jgi:hypothetical protein